MSVIIDPGSGSPMESDPPETGNEKYAINDVNGNNRAGVQIVQAASSYCLNSSPSA